MLEHHEEGLDGKKVAVSGSGNVAIYATQKLIGQRPKVVMMSDLKGFIHCPKGLNEEQWNTIRELKETSRGRLAKFKSEGITYYDGERPQ